MQVHLQAHTHTHEVNIFLIKGKMMYKQNKNNKKEKNIKGIKILHTKSILNE